MTSLYKKQKGFTIVELLIVIVVIGILAALVVNTFSGIQKKARDTERQTDINTLHGQLEAFYAQNGYYPYLDNFNDASWRSTNMKGLDDDALKDPKGSASTLASAAAANVYSYVATLSDGTTACTAANETTCDDYTLTATAEGTINGNATYVKSSLN